MAPPKQLLSDIAQMMGLIPEDIAQRKEFLEFTEADIKRLSEVHAHIESLHFDEVFADLFYRHLRSFPELRKFIPDDATVNRLKALQSQYFKRLTAGDYGEDYVLDRLCVGHTHQKIGLQPKWYTGAYRKYLSFLLTSLCELAGIENRAFLENYDALLKVVFFDMELALDTYFHSDRQELLHLANHDALTGLPNRILLSDRLDQALLQAHREENNLAILFIDLDRFKNINDSLGHPIGDGVITEVSSRLVESLREGDTVARTGGDEFVVVLSDVGQEQNIASIAEKLLHGIAQPMVVGGNDLFVSASIGIAVYPMDGETQDDLLKNADTAMFRAKHEGSNAFRFYQREMNSLSLSRLNLEAKLRRALEKREFILHYQPQVDMANGRIVGVEALLRWHTDDVLISPDEFIPIAEETGLILPIGQWVLEASCRQAVIWNQTGEVPLKVAVNLSARQIWEQDIVGTISRILMETGCDPRWLELEITESALMKYPELAAATLNNLAGMGITLSIDDFGTGYSSLSYLKQFPINSLKIDRSFVTNISSDPDDASIVRAVIALAKSLDLMVVGEGIEDESQVSFLRNLGCHVVQGYFFSRPQLDVEISKMLLHAPVWAVLFKQRQETDFSANLAVDDSKRMHNINSCRVCRDNSGRSKCMISDIDCIFKLSYKSLCCHPLVGQIADADGKSEVFGIFE